MGGFCTFLLAFAQDIWPSAPNIRLRRQCDTVTTATCSQCLSTGTPTPQASSVMLVRLLVGQQSEIWSSAASITSCLQAFCGMGVQAPLLAGPSGLQASPSSALLQGPARKGSAWDSEGDTVGQRAWSLSEGFMQGQLSSQE